jgi:hypothetical protein
MGQGRQNCKGDKMTMKLKTVKALGLSIPASVLSIADEVIE